MQTILLAAAAWIAGSSPLPAFAQGPLEPLGQYDVDGVTPVPAGGALSGNTVTLAVRVPSFGAGVIVFVQVLPVGQAFGHDPAGGKEVPAGRESTIVFTQLQATDYHWAIIAYEPPSRPGGFFFFQVGEFPGDPAFTVLWDHSTPDAPTDLRQERADGSPLPIGTSVSDGTVTFSGMSACPDGHQVRLEVQGAADGVPYPGGASGLGSIVPGGERAGVTLALTPGHWIWRARCVCEAGVPSEWREFNDPAVTGPAIIVEGPPPLRAPELPAGSGDNGCLGSACGSPFPILAVLLALVMARTGGCR